MAFHWRRLAQRSPTYPTPQMCPWTRMHFYRDMGQTMKPVEPRFVDRWVLRFVSHEEATTAECPGPTCQTCKSLTRSSFISNRSIIFLESLIWDHIEQHFSSRPHQAERPKCNHDSTDQSDCRVHPHPAIKSRTQQCDDRQNGC